MANTKTTNPALNKYKKIGIIAAVVVVVAILGIWGLSALRNRGDATIAQAMDEVSETAVSGADLRIAVVRMDAIQTEATALKQLRAQKESYESKLRDELTREQKALEKEKAEIEKSQDVLSRDALARRVADYQSRVTKLQRDLAERAQSVDVAFQKALADIQAKHLDPIIQATIEKKKLSMVIDGRFARTGNVENLDITDEIIRALNKRVSSVKMETPKGF